MKVLFLILVLCTLALLGVAAAVYMRARRHMRAQASDTALRPALQEFDDDQSKPSRDRGNHV